MNMPDSNTAAERVRDERETRDEELYEIYAPAIIDRIVDKMLYGGICVLPGITWMGDFINDGLGTTNNDNTLDDLCDPHSTGFTLARLVCGDKDIRHEERQRIRGKLEIRIRRFLEDDADAQDYIMQRVREETRDD